MEIVFEMGVGDEEYIVTADVEPGCRTTWNDDGYGPGIAALGVERLLPDGRYEEVDDVPAALLKRMEAHALNEAADESKRAYEAAESMEWHPLV